MKGRDNIGTVPICWHDGASIPHRCRAGFLDTRQQRTFRSSSYMIKKSIEKDKETVFDAGTVGGGRKRSLGIKEIRVLAERLAAQPDAAPMPDWSKGTTIGDRFAIALRLVPSDQREQLLGKSKPQIDRYERGGEIPLMVVAALAAETEIPLDWLVTGRGQARAAPVAYVTAEQPQGDSSIVAVERLAFRAAAGRGQIIIDEHAGWEHLPKALLDRAGVKPQHARILEADGISMVPTIGDRAPMLLDVSATEVKDGLVYLFAIGEEAYVKRLRRRGGRLMMSSDNRELYPDDEPVPQDQLRIIGQIKWAWRSV